jgi:hypothetical protein
MLKKTAPDTKALEPWDGQIEVYLEAGMTLAKAWDKTILMWLKDGDLGPLRTALIAGHIPHRRVLLYLATMMSPDSQPHRIGVRKGRGNPRQQARHWRRDFDLAMKVWVGMQDDPDTDKPGLSYESAISEVAEEFGLSDSTVRDAYKKWKPS